ncbi:MAG: hypothetical protein JW959_03540 [Pirellulales bacterium]|nr:hypothetical protein [Pirellulales bacterium]
MSDGSTLRQLSADVRRNDVEQGDPPPALTLYVSPPDRRRKMLFLPVAGKACCAAIALWMVASLLVQSNVGLADNGDFWRINRLFTSGPVEIYPPRPDTLPERDPKYIHFWTQYWHFDRPVRDFKALRQHTFNTSTVLLWLPGVFWNYWFYSPHVLHASSLSLLPRITLVLVLLLIFRWIRGDDTTTPGEKLALCAVIGFPFALLATTTDYVAYLNSFYFETGSLIYLFLFFAAFTYAMRRSAFSGRAAIVWPAAALLLLTAAKIGNIYWPLLAVPFVMGCCSGGLRRRYRLSVGAVLIIALTAASVKFLNIDPGAVWQNSFNRLFDGALAFSNDPAKRLAELGMADCERFVGKSVFCFSDEELSTPMSYGNPLPLSSFLYVLYREPAVVLRMMKHAADNMQTISLPYLRTRPYEEPYMPTGAAANLWSDLKASCFPTGYALYGALALYSALFFAAARNARQSAGLRRELSLLGLMATIACFIDMNASIFGDGRHEQVKHLFFANLLFDLSTIAAASVAFLFAVAWLKGRTFRTPSSVIALAPARPRP